MLDPSVSTRLTIHAVLHQLSRGGSILEAAPLNNLPGSLGSFYLSGNFTSKRAWEEACQIFERIPE